MDEFIAERVKLVRQLADRADPFTKIRLLKLADHYDDRLRPRSKGCASTDRSSTDKHRLIGTLKRRHATIPRRGFTFAPIGGIMGESPHECDLAEELVWLGIACFNSVSG
jgi:hypothetical protein